MRTKDTIFSAAGGERKVRMVDGNLVSSAGESRVLCTRKKMTALPSSMTALPSSMCSEAERLRFGAE